MIRLLKKLVVKYFNLKTAVIILTPILIIFVFLYMQKTRVLNNKILNLNFSEANLRGKLTNTNKQLTILKNEDQYKKNIKLEETIKKIEDTYKQSIKVYEKMLDLKDSGNQEEYAKLFAQSLTYLTERSYSSASAVLKDLDQQIAAEQTKIAASFKIPAGTVTSNTPPSSGYSSQRVSTDIGSFLVDIISADLNSTRVIVDTASDSDCKDNCPVLSLADYVSRSGAFAGVNGSYFCPAEYPSCAGKTNSYDTLAMNKSKTYFNSDNNVYSTVPVVIFSGNSARFVGASQEWGRDTSVDSVLANHPLLLSSGNIVFGGNSDPKQGSKGNRSFVGTTNSTVYIGVVFNATVAEMAVVLNKMGIQNALNLDSGGSTALWSGGYIVGPGRNIPNALLFVQK